MADTRDYRVLVPVDVLEGQDISRSLVDAFASVSVVLLGYHEIPDQTGPDQARAEFGETARRKLADHRSVFEAAGCDVTSTLVFTHKPLQTFERTAVDRDCDAILLLNPAPVLERFLVAFRGDVNVDRIARLVGAILTETDITVTLLHVVDDDTERADGERLLDTAATALTDVGIDEERIDRSVVVDGSPTDEILDAASECDLVVAGESRPSIRRFIFRDRAKRIAKRTADPVLMVRGSYADSEGDESPAADGE